MTVTEEIKNRIYIAQSKQQNMGRSMCNNELLVIVHYHIIKG